MTKQKTVLADTYSNNYQSFAGSGKQLDGTPTEAHLALLHNISQLSEATGQQQPGVTLTNTHFAVLGRTSQLLETTDQQPSVTRTDTHFAVLGHTSQLSETRDQQASVARVKEAQPSEGLEKPYTRVVVLTSDHLALIRNERFASVPLIAHDLADQAITYAKDVDRARNLVVSALNSVHLDLDIRQALFKETLRQITKRDAQLMNTQTTNMLWVRLSRIEQSLLNMQQAMQTLINGRQQEVSPELSQRLHKANKDRLAVARRYIAQTYWFFLCLVIVAGIMGFWLAYRFPNVLMNADVLFLGGIIGNVIGGFAGIQHIRASAHARLELNEGPDASLFDVELEHVMAKARKLLLLLVLSVPISAAMVLLSMWLLSSQGVPLDKNLVLAWITAIVTAILAFTAGSVNYGARMGPIVGHLLHPITRLQRLPLSERM